MTRVALAAVLLLVCLAPAVAAGAADAPAGLGLIAGYAFSAPYEDLKLKAT